MGFNNSMMFWKSGDFLTQNHGDFRVETQGGGVMMKNNPDDFKKRGNHVYFR